MKLAALLLLLAAEPAVLRDEVDLLPPGQWRYDSFALKDQVPATVDCTYVVAKPGRVRVELMTRENLHSMLHGGDYETIAKGQGGRLTREMGAPGEFAIVVTNEEKTREAQVALRLTLDFSNQNAGKARYLSPGRKSAVILLSFFGFLAIVTLSARKLLLAMRR
jgi:hypothetical protein